MLFWIKDTTWKCSFWRFWRHQFTHVCVLTFGACEAQTSLTIMFEFEKIFRSCCTCPWHTYIYIYICIHSSSRPSLSFVLPGLCKVLICCMGWSQRFGGMTTTMICSRCIFFEIYIYIYIGLEPLVWKVQEAFIYNIYIYLLYVTRIRQKLVHSKEMILASCWSVAWRTFYRQILSLLYSSFFFWNFRPRLDLKCEL